MAKRRFGPYEILSELGRGGMGVVYRARHVDMPGRIVALKLVRPSGKSADRDEARFQREARALAAIQHPNVTVIHAYGEADGFLFIAMEMCEGPSLAAAIDRGAIPCARALEYMAQVCEGVGFAHSLGIVHRDLKPQNILTDAHGNAKVTDFGLSKALEGAERVTATGAILGTPYYMSPEQARGEAITADARTDVFSLGVVLYEVLTKTRPFDGRTPGELFDAIATLEPPDPGTLCPGLPEGVAAVCAKALAKEPDERYPTAREMADDLRRVLAGGRVAASAGFGRPSRRPLRLAILLGAFAVALLFVLAYRTVFRESGTGGGPGPLLAADVQSIRTDLVLALDEASHAPDIEERRTRLDACTRDLETRAAEFHKRHAGADAALANQALAAMDAYRLVAEEAFRLHFHTEHPDDARRVFEALRRAKGGPDVDLLAARAHRIGRDIDAAETVLTRLLASNPGDPEGIAERGLCRLARGDLESAGRDFQLAEQITPGIARRPLLLLTEARTAQAWERSAASWDLQQAPVSVVRKAWIDGQLAWHSLLQSIRGLAAEDGEPEMVLLEARCLVRLGEEATARRVLGRAEREMPHATRIILVLADLLAAAHGGEARGRYERLLATHPKFRVPALLGLARLAFFADEPAQSAYRKVLEAEALQPEAREMVAYLDLIEAVEPRAPPAAGEPTAATLLIEALYEAYGHGDLAAARRLADEARRISPREADVHAVHAAVAGDRESAERAIHILRNPFQSAGRRYLRARTALQEVLQARWKLGLDPLLFETDPKILAALPQVDMARAFHALRVLQVGSPRYGACQTLEFLLRFFGGQPLRRGLASFAWAHRFHRVTGLRALQGGIRTILDRLGPAPIPWGVNLDGLLEEGPEVLGEDRLLKVYDWFYAAQIRMAFHDPLKAAFFLERALQQGPWCEAQDPQASLWQVRALVARPLASLLRDAGRTAESRALVASLTQAGFRDHRRQAALELHEASRNLDQEEPEKAIPMLERLLEVEPLHPWAHRLLSEAIAAQAGLDVASAAYFHWVRSTELAPTAMLDLELSPETFALPMAGMDLAALARSWKGDVFETTGPFLDLIRSFKEIREAGEDQRVEQEFGLLFDVHQHLLRHPDLASAWMLESFVQQDLGRMDQASEAARTAAVLAPSDPAPPFLLARHHHESGEKEAEIVSALQGAVRLGYFDPSRIESIFGARISNRLKAWRDREAPLVSPQREAFRAVKPVVW